MTEQELDKHKIAARKLNLIKDRAFGFIKKNLGKVTEYDVHQFIIEEYKKENLVFDDAKYSSLIVASDKNTSFVHYFPAKKDSLVINENSLVMIDIWGRLDEDGAPFADITWMGYCGQKIPAEIQGAFKKVASARDAALILIKKKLSEISSDSEKLFKTIEVDQMVREEFGDFKRFFIHGTGHSLGFLECHGKYFRFRKNGQSSLKKEIPFTIEPGLYFKNKFGIRSEINCYVSRDLKLIITTKVQKKLIRI